MDVRRPEALSGLQDSLHIQTESASCLIGLITLGVKQTGKRSAGNPHAAFDEAGTGNRLTVRTMRHSQRKRGATDRPNLRSTAPVLDPTQQVSALAGWDFLLACQCLIMRYFFLQAKGRWPGQK